MHCTLAATNRRIWDRTFLRLPSSNTEGENDVGRALSPVVATLIAVASVTALLGQTPDAAQVMASAREALGGEKKLSAVRSFVATGRTRQLRGNNLVPIEFEINCELPDKFVRKDEIPAQDTDPTTRGFNGDALIQVPPPGAGRGGPRAGGPGPGGPAARRSTARRRRSSRWSAASGRTRPRRTTCASDRRGQTGLRAADAGNVRDVVPELPADVQVRRSRRGA